MEQASDFAYPAGITPRGPEHADPDEVTSATALREVRRQLRALLGENAELKKRLEAETIYLREAAESGPCFDNIVGESDTLRCALHKADQVAPMDTAVLLLGETGTGKELLARAIHRRSRRHDRPLVVVNCAALPSTLIESEFFGHEKGAFTGALGRKIGRFELADGGTILLDEIGDLPLDLQAKLLHVLQRGEFERVGSTTTLHVDVRVIASTNRRLDEEATNGLFRADLYYRLSVFPIELPPLRERRGDVPLLVWYFIEKLQRKLGRKIVDVPVRAMEALTAYSWPGNVRELENVIERALILSSGPVLAMEEGFARVVSEGDMPASDRTLAQVERAHILRVLDECKGRIKGRDGAAACLGLPPSTLWSRMKKLGIGRAIAGS